MWDRLDNGTLGSVQASDRRVIELEVILHELGRRKCKPLDDLSVLCQKLSGRWITDLAQADILEFV